MSVLLSFAMGAVVFVLMMAWVATSAFLGRRSDAAVLLLSSLASSALTIPALLAGSFASYLTFDTVESRRRVRRRLIIVVGVQVAGLVVVIVLVAIGALALGPTVALTVASFTATPVCILLGRAALRREATSAAAIGSNGTQQNLLGPLEGDIRRGYRNGAIGAAGGVALGLVLLVLGDLLLDGGRSGGSLSFGAELWFLPALGCIGGGIGLLTRLFRVSAAVRRTVGTDYGGLRRLARVVVRGKPDQLIAEEERVAPLYAAMISRTLRYSLAASGANLLGVLFLQFESFHSARLESFRLVLVAAIAVTLVWAIVLAVLNTGRARAYAAAHPLGTVSV